MDELRYFRNRSDNISAALATMPAHQAAIEKSNDPLSRMFPALLGKQGCIAQGRMRHGRSDGERKNFADSVVPQLCPWCSNFGRKFAPDSLHTLRQWGT